MNVNRAVLLGALAASTLAVSSALAASATPVMAGLDNPRGLAFGRHGALYVVQGGKGGSGPCQVLRGATQCYGPTGRISRLWRGRQEDVVTGLPSYVATTGPEASIGTAAGPQDIAILGDHAVITIGWGADPALRTTAPAEVWQRFGRLVYASLERSRRFWLGPDVSAYETLANPDGGAVDSNPYGLLGWFKRGIVVTDAGANDLLRVRRSDASGEDHHEGRGRDDDESDDDDDEGEDHDGTRISTLAVFPSRSTNPQHPSCAGFPPGTDSVPTSVTIGPDGAYYVGELSGVPFCAGNASIYRIVRGEEPTVYCGGFTTILDHAWGPDGKLYVLQHSNGPVFFGTQGNVVRVDDGCVKTVVSPDLNRPGSLAFGPRGKLYVSVNSNATGTGQVVRIDP